MRTGKIILLSAAFSFVTISTNAFPWMSPYVYCMGNPVMLVDPDGRASGDYYNTSGKNIGTDGIDDQRKFIVLDNKEARLFQKTGSVEDVNSEILVPSLEVISQTNKAIDLTEQSNSEHGFVVSTNGNTSSMYSGNSGSVQTGRGFEEIEKNGGKTAFDVHTHPLDYQPGSGTAYKIGDYKPSDHDVRMRGVREENMSVSQPSWVIGYQIREGAQPTMGNNTRVVTFYNSGGIIRTVNWRKFEKTVNKILAR